MDENNENVGVLFQEELFEIRFDYPVKYIKASVLSEYINSFNKVIQDVSLSQGLTHEMIIVATPEGSFKIKAFLQQMSQTDFFQSLKYIIDSPEKRFLIQTILTIIGGVSTFYLAMLKLNPDEIHIKQEKGDIYIFSDSQISIEVPKKIYQVANKYPNIKSNIGKMNAVIAKEKDLKKLELNYKDQENTSKTIEWSLDEIKELSKIQHVDINLKSFEYIHLTEQSIKVTKVDFEGRSKWTMLLNGEKHSVAIDSDTLPIMQNEQISNKDTFIVDITIQQKYSESLDAYINDKYTITYLHQHIPYDDPEPYLPY